MSTPAGWYDDGSGRQRWWDGQQWTEHFAPEVDAQAQADAQAIADAQAEADAQAGVPSVEQNPTEVYPPSDYTAPGYTPPSAPGSADTTATAAYPGAYQAPGPGQYDAGQYDAGQPYGTGQPYGAAQPGEPAGPRKTPVLGFIGLGLAVVGTILACIPVTFIFGLIVLFAALVVSIIALFQKNTAKWPSITGLILSIVGGIIGAVIFTATVLFAIGSAVSELPSSSISPEESDAPSDGADGSGEGRPSSEEVADGIDEIIETTGMTGELTDEQITCYADYFIASDIPDETLWVIASGDDALTDGDAVREFSEKLAEGVDTCLIP